MRSCSSAQLSKRSCTPDKLRVALAANTDAIFEWYYMTDETRRYFQLWWLFFACLRVNEWTEIEYGEKACESKPHVCVCKITTWADSVHKSLVVRKQKSCISNQIPSSETKDYGTGIIVRQLIEGRRPVSASSHFL